jgi:hypothetical protein
MIQMLHHFPQICSAVRAAVPLCFDDRLQIGGSVSTARAALLNAAITFGNKHLFLITLLPRCAPLPPLLYWRGKPVCTTFVFATRRCSAD